MDGRNTRWALAITTGVGAGIGAAGSSFVGTESAPSPAGAARADRCSRVAGDPAAAADASFAGHYERRGGARAGAHSKGVKAWLHELRTFAAGAPSGPILPPLPADADHSWLRVVAVGPQGHVLCSSGQWGRQSWVCGPPFDAWHLVGGPSRPDEVRRGDACFRPGHRELLVSLRGRGIGISTFPSPELPSPVSDVALPSTWAAVLERNPGSACQSVACSPDGQRVVASVEVAGGWRIMEADLRTGRATIGTLRSPVIDVAFDATGRYIIATDVSGEVRVRDGQAHQGPFGAIKTRRFGAALGPPVRRLALHASAPEALALWGDGRVAALDLAQRKRIGSEQQWPQVIDVAHNPADDTFVALSRLGERHVVRPPALNRPQLVGSAVDLPRAQSLSFDPSGEWYVTVHEDGTVRAWDAKTHGPWQG